MPVDKRIQKDIKKICLLVTQKKIEQDIIGVNIREKENNINKNRYSTKLNHKTNLP